MKKYFDENIYEKVKEGVKCQENYVLMVQWPIFKFWNAKCQTHPYWRVQNFNYSKNCDDLIGLIFQVFYIKKDWIGHRLALLIFYVSWKGLGREYRFLCFVLIFFLKESFINHEKTYKCSPEETITNEEYQKR